MKKDVFIRSMNAGILSAMVYAFALSLGFLVPPMAMQYVEEADSIVTGLLANMVAQPVYKPNPDKEEE